MRIIKNGACKLQDIQQFKCQICGCIYELDLCNEEIGECPCCHAHKSYQVRFKGDAGYNYGTTTGQYVTPNTVTTIGDVNKLGSGGVTGKVDPSITIYANKLPDDIVDDPYNNIGMRLPDDVKDNCCYESDDYKVWYEKWCKEIREREPVKCNK